MKRKFIFPFVILLFVSLIPFSVSAAGNGFVASKNSDVFHIMSCYHVNKIYDSNKIFFDTYQEAKNSGRRGCYSCNPSSWYDNSGSSVSSAKKDMSQYNSGFSAGERYGYSKGYEEGRKVGYSSGYEMGKSDTLKNDITPQIEKTRKNTIIWTLVLNYLFVRPIFQEVVFSISDSIEKKKSQPRRQEDSSKTFVKKQVSVVHTNEIRFIDYRDTVLIVIFSNGREVHHYDVPEDIYNGFMTSPSKIDYYNNWIADEFPRC